MPMPNLGLGLGLGSRIVSGGGGGGGLVAYIATVLPNVPTGSRSAVANAATSAASGQSYSAESIIDALALSYWASPHPEKSFVNTADTTSTTAGNPVGKRTAFNGSIQLLQSTTSAKPTLTADGDSLQTDDYWAASPTTVRTGDWAILIVLNPSSLTKSIYYPISFGSASGIFSGGTFVSNKAGLNAAGTLIQTPTAITTGQKYLIRATKAGTSYSVSVNGSTNSNTGTAGATLDLTSFQVGRRNDNQWFFDGTLWDVCVAPSDSNRKLERFFASYNGITLV